jgi:glycosyltransferase involved in cell wall biosynthesis
VTHVLHVMPHPGGGAETYVDLLAGLPGHTHQRLYLTDTRAPGPAIARALARVARTPADIVHAHGDVAAVLGQASRRGRPFVISSHGLHMLRRAPEPARSVFAAALARATRAAATTICESRAERDELAALAPDARLVVIPNGIALPPLGDRQRVRAELGLADADVLGVFVGQLEPRKEPLLAIDAAERTGPPFVLALAGDGPDSAAVAARSGPAVRPLGFRTDLPDIFAAADVYVAPSRREGVSYALLEAMGAGLPTIVADGPGSPEVVGDAGLVVPAGDVDALAAALRTLATDPARRAALGDAARRRVADAFSLDRFLAATARAYSA